MGENEQAGMLRMVVVIGLIAIISSAIISTAIGVRDSMKANNDSAHSTLVSTTKNHDPDVSPFDSVKDWQDMIVSDVLGGYVYNLYATPHFGETALVKGDLTVSQDVPFVMLNQLQYDNDSDNLVGFKSGIKIVDSSGNALPTLNRIEVHDDLLKTENLIAPVSDDFYEPIITPLVDELMTSGGVYNLKAGEHYHFEMSWRVLAETMTYNSNSISYADLMSKESFWGEVYAEVLPQSLDENGTLASKIATFSNAQIAWVK